MGRVLNKIGRVLAFLVPPYQPASDTLPSPPSPDSYPPIQKYPEDPRPKDEKNQSARELAAVISAMNTYLVRADHDFHVQRSMIYCNSCQTIGLSGGDYSVSTGNDCLGTHYKRVSHPETCHSCESNDFVRISPSDILALKSKDPADIIEGIKRGLERMGFPSLYNKRLPSVADRWKELSEAEKLAQVASMLKINQKIVEAQEKVRGLEASLED